MIWSLDARIRDVERQLAAIEEERHVLVTLRPWFWRVSRWLLGRRMRRLKAELTELWVRRRWRMERQ